METAKSVAFRWARLFSVKPEPVDVVGVVVVLVVVVLLVIVGLWNEIVGFVAAALERILNAELLQLGLADLHHHKVDDDLGLSLVEIVDQQLRQRHLVRRAAHHDYVLRRKLLYPLHSENGANQICHILQFADRRKIVQIKSAQHLLLHFAALLLCVLRNVNRVRRHRTPEGARFQRHHLQRLLQRNSIQLDAYSSRHIVGIEQHVDARQLANRLVDGFRILGQFQRQWRR